MRSISTILATFMLGGCGAADNDRLKVKPLWSNPNLEIDKRPVIHDGIVYAQPRGILSAFDLKTGKQLWTSKFMSDEIIMTVGTLIAVTDDKGMLHSLNTKTGAENGEPSTSMILSATASGNMVYAIFKDRSVVAFDRPGHVLWKAAVPMSILFHPEVGGANVYIYGGVQDAKGLKNGCAVHAFDAASGALRWKWESQDCSGTEDVPFSALSADAGAAYIRIDAPTKNDKAGALIALDALTGKQKWMSPTVNFEPGTPMFADDSTIAIFDNIPGDHGGTATRKNPSVLRGLDRSTGQVKFENRTASKYGSSWTAKDGLVFIADRTAHALIGTGNATSPDSFLTVVDIRSGKELWKSETVTLGTFTTPVVEDGIVVVGSLPFGNENPNAAGLFAFPATRGPAAK